jgi:FkbM family methyltransferase
LKLFIIKILRRIGSQISKSVSNYKISYSQCAEDLLIAYIFNLRKIKNPSYLDLGANHPFYISNTAKFYVEGSRGINVEANPQLIGLFNKYRPADINLNIGVSDQEGELEFYIMEDNTLSTFSKEEMESMILNGKVLAEIKNIKVTTLQKIIEDHFNGDFPDLLSIDVEGLDFQILKSINYEKSSPKVICVEAAEYSLIGAGSRRDELIDFLVDKGYYEYANTNLNAIMVRNDFWFRK